MSLIINQTFKMGCNYFSHIYARTINLPYLYRRNHIFIFCTRYPEFNFIRKVMQQLHADNLVPIKGDVFKFIPACKENFDLIFADPPYDLPKFGTIPELVLNSELLKPEGIFIIEHSKSYDFSTLPGFDQKRTYGSVNFSFFRNIHRDIQ